MNFTCHIGERMLQALQTLVVTITGHVGHIKVERAVDDGRSWRTGAGGWWNGR